MAKLSEMLKAMALALLPGFILQPLKRIHYANTLRQSSESDEQDLQVVRHLVRPGDHVIDVGANIGFYSKFLSTWVGPEGRVYSIEPIPPTFDILKSNAGKLRLANLQLQNCAVSDRNTNLRMEVPPYDSGGDNYYQARVVNEKSEVSTRSFVVETHTLDSLFAGSIGEITFIKCDVEGHELNCIRGGIKLIQRFMPAWLIEVSGDPTQQAGGASQTFELMRSHGYETFWFDGTHLKKWAPGERSVNYFFLTSRHAGVLEKFLPPR